MACQSTLGRSGVGLLSGFMLLVGFCLVHTTSSATPRLPSTVSSTPQFQLLEGDASSRSHGGCGSCPTGSDLESETCSEQSNGGCDDGSFTQTPLTCGTIMCGQTWADSGYIDVDWYKISLADLDGDGQDMLQLHVESEIPVIVQVFETCSAPPYQEADADGCDSADIELCLVAPKDYYIRVLPGKLATGPIDDGFPCSLGLRYTIDAVCSDVCTVGACPGCQPAPEGLVAWWPLDEGGGATVFDELIFENDADGEGGYDAGAAGKVDNGVKFSGVGRLLADDLNNLDFPEDQDFTAMAWLKLPADPTGFEPLVDKRTPQGEAECGWYFTTFDGRVGFRMTDADGLSGAWLSPQLIGDGEWHHVAVTVDRSESNGIRFYVDGVQAGPAKDATLVPGDLSTDADISIAASQRLDGAGSLPALVGTLDEVQIFHRSLFPNEVYDIADADCGGVCKIRMHISRITPFCGPQPQSQAVVTVNNMTSVDQVFNLDFEGVGADQGSDYCVQDGPTGFIPQITNPFTVPAGGTLEIPVLIDRPSGLINDADSACWTATLESTTSGFELTRKGVVTVVEQICVVGETNAVLQIPVGQPTPVKFTVHNNTTADYPLYWKAAPVVSETGQLNQLMQLEAEEPGDELFGFTMVPAGSSIDIQIHVLYLQQRADEKEEGSRYSDVVFYEDPGTDVPWESSDSVGTEPASSPDEDEEACGTDINCDGIVDVNDLLEVIAAWGECPADEPCPADTNGDGVVDVNDLLAVISDWS